MTSANLAINGGEPLRSQPFGPKWIFGDEERRHLMEVMDNATDAWRSGFKVRAFADAFATLHGAQYAVATTTGTGAIHAAVAAVNPEPGDEIITTPTTDIGSVLGIILHNAIPVFADWDPETLNTDPADIEHRITPRTRAILVVHLYGNPCDMGPILEIGRAHNLPVIEDCSQAHLAEYRGQLVGTIGDIGCFSLGGKTLTTDQGGMVITNDEPLARRAMGFSRKGSEMDSALRSSLAPTSFRRGGNKGYAFLGDSHPMTDLHAAVGLAQFDRWQEATRVRRMTAAILDEVVPQLPGFKIQKVHPEDRSAYYTYAYTPSTNPRPASPPMTSPQPSAPKASRTATAPTSRVAPSTATRSSPKRIPTVSPAIPSLTSRAIAASTTARFTSPTPSASCPRPASSSSATPIPNRTPKTSPPPCAKWPSTTPSRPRNRTEGKGRGQY